MLFSSELNVDVKLKKEKKKKKMGGEKKNGAQSVSVPT